MEEDPHGFIDRVLKVLDSMHVSSQEKAKLAAYQHKDVEQVWYDHEGMRGRFEKFRLLGEL